jgi:hypothetical protein
LRFISGDKCCDLEAAMISFRRFAFFTVARDSAFVTLAAATLMVAFSFEPPLALKIGATVALIFSLSLLLRGYLLTEDRFLRSEAWQALRPDERPTGEWERRLAHARLKVLLLRFAKGASAIASILYGAALVLSTGGALAGL